MSNQSVNVVLAALAGAAVGVGVGMLLAPDSGANTRKKIKDKFSDSRDNWSKKLDEFLEGVKHKSGDLLEGLDALISDLHENKPDEADELIALLEKKLAVLKQQSKKS